MSDIAIKVEDLSKLYRLGDIGTGTIKNDLQRWYARARGKEDPFVKIGQTNDRTKKAESDFVWALKDINFEVKKGEVLGIIGRNGAGKSTLLKILSKITAPTTGKIYIDGRIASLLEVGTGFHPELSGRENIFMNGAILGMRKWEIKKKFDEIVDFAGVEAYIDTPVKRYSSGMYVRLAFAVAAFLEPEILIVDEVLAVGDAEFQKKCLGRMKDVSTNEGRTVLFVSHNMAAISHLCSNALLLANGGKKILSSVDKTIDSYLSELSNQRTKKIDVIKNHGNGQFQFTNLRYRNAKGTITDTFNIGEELLIEFLLENENTSFERVLHSHIDIGFNNSHDIRVAWISSSLKTTSLDFKRNSIVFRIPKINFIPGEYNINYQLSINNEIVDWKQNVGFFQISDFDFYGTGKAIRLDQGFFALEFELK